MGYISDAFAQPNLRRTKHTGIKINRYSFALVMPMKYPYY
jgi:hypothetical protein